MCGRVGAGGCGDGDGDDGGGDGVEVNSRRCRIQSLDWYCGLKRRLRSVRVGVASGFCGAGAVRRDSHFAGAEVLAVVAASVVEKDNSSLVVFEGRALSLLVAEVVSQDRFGVASSHEIAVVVVVAVETAQSMEAACSRMMVLRMVVDIVAALVAAIGMDSADSYLEAPGRLACPDSILALPCLKSLLQSVVCFALALVAIQRNKKAIGRSKNRKAKQTSWRPWLNNIYQSNSEGLVHLSPVID